MSDYDGNFMDLTSSCWAAPPSPSLSAMLDEIDNGVDPISDIFPQTNSSTNHQSERIFGLGAPRLKINIPPLQINNNSLFADFCRNPTTVPSPVVLVSSALLQSPNVLSDFPEIIPPSNPGANDGPPQTVESSGEDHATMMISNNDLPHQPTDVDQEGSVDIPVKESVSILSTESHIDSIGTPLVASDPVAEEPDIFDLIIFDSDGEDEEAKEDEDKDADHNTVDVLNIAESPSSKRRKLEEAKMIGTTRSSKNQRFIIQVETEEDHPDDGFNWRKYGTKVVNGNTNPRGYYKCANEGCKVKKHVERGASNVKLVVTTYNGKHRHEPPARRHRMRPRTSSSKFQDQSNHQTARLNMPPSSSSAASQDMMPFSSSVGPQIDMTQHYINGLSKLLSLPVNENHGFMYRNGEPKIDRVIPEGTEASKGVMGDSKKDFRVNFRTNKIKTLFPIITRSGIQ